MAIAVVNKKQTGSLPASSVAITSATKGNTLNVFIATVGTTAPKPKDNISGETGWTVEGNHALYGSSLDTLWFAKKVAVGGETSVEATGGTVQGVCCVELSGASETAEVVSAKSNIATAVTATSEAITTADAGDIILACVGFNAASGAVNAWTGTGPMTNVETGTTRCLGGYYLPGTTLTAATFTANWTTTHPMGMLVVAIKPAGATPSGSGAVTGGGNVAATGSRIAKGSPQVTGAGRVPIPTTSNRIAKGAGAISGGGNVTATGARIAKGAPSVTGAGLVSATGAKPAAHEAKVTGGGNVTASGSRRASAVAKVTGAGSTSASGSTRRSASVSVSGAGNLATTASRIASGSGKVTGAGLTALTSSRRASGVAQVTGAGRTLATYSTKRSGSASVTGAGRVLAEGVNTVKPTVVRVTGGGLVVATGAAGPTYQFPLGEPRPGHASVGQVGRLGPVRGRITSGNQGGAR